MTTGSTPNLHDLAQRYQITSAKPFFPVNSLRLVYYIFSDHYTSQSAAARDLITALIPKLEAIFRARTDHRTSATAATTLSDFAATEAARTELFTTLDTPATRSICDFLLSSIYPLQDELFLHIYQTMMSESPTATPILTAQTLSSFLALRAMDSVVFSTLLGEVIFHTTPTADRHLQPALHTHLNVMYQINDLVDAVVFAREDLDSKNFSPFEVIRKVAPEPATAKELIHNTFAKLRQRATDFPLPEPLQGQVELFYEELVGVVSGKR